MGEMGRLGGGGGDNQTYLTPFILSFCVSSSLLFSFFLLGQLIDFFW